MGSNPLEGRLVVDDALPGAMNMAVDEAILGQYDEQPRPTLRFYRWQPATLSLGYFQDADEITQQSTAVRELPAVRRCTGGGAILHDDELTYSLTIGLDHEAVRTSAVHLYDLVHEAVIATAATIGVTAQIRGCGSGCGDDRPVRPSGSSTSGTEDAVSCGSSRRGPFFCFGRQHATDVVAEGVKMAGSAQRRSRTAVLQHGSIILRRHYAEQPCVGLFELASHDMTIDALQSCLAEQIADRLGCRWQQEALSEDERSRLDALTAKYSRLDWPPRRRAASGV